MSDYVFINHRVPYGRLKYKLLPSCFKQSSKQKNGFHITRKTFASLMLKNRINADTIADSLGHSNNSTVLKYLATDGDTMRQCAFHLNGIEINGGMLL